MCRLGWTQSSWNHREAYVSQIVDIQLKGLETVSEEVVYSVLSIAVGDSFSLLSVNSDIKKLYYLGFFKDIDFDFKERDSGVVLTFYFEERRRLANFKIVGQKIIGQRKIKELFNLKEGEYFDYYMIHEKIVKLRALYHEKGFLEVDVQYEVKSTSRKGYIDFILKINEDIRYKITEINICGVPEKDQVLLKKFMETKTHIFILRSGYFRESAYELDKSRIESYFKDKGYLNCHIESDDVVRDDDEGEIKIQINVNLGDLFYVGAIDLIGGELLGEVALFDLMEIQSNEEFSYSKILASQQAIQKTYGRLGFVFCSVDIQTYIHEEDRVVDLSFDIDPKGEVYVYGLSVEGNTVTDSHVILRELQFGLLSRVDEGKLSKSRYNLQSLDYFESVDFSFEPVDMKDFYEVKVTVKEKKTGLFTFGGGYSTVDDVVGFVRLTQKNFNLFGPPFVGGGEQLTLNLDFGHKRRNYYLDFVEPWFWGHPVSMGFRIYDKFYDVSSYSGYQEHMKGMRLLFGRRFFHQSLSVSFQWENIDIIVLDRSAVPPSIWHDRGDYDVNTTTMTWKIFDRDHPFFPTKGYELKSIVSVLGSFLGGNLDIYKLDVSFEIYKQEPFFEGVFKLKWRGATLLPFNETEDVPIFQKYFLGGARTVRGYRERGVGPRFLGEPVGGSSLGLFVGEYWYTLNEVIRVSAFCDMGNVWEDDLLNIPLDSFKVGIGVGVWVRTPIGPIRIDYGIPLDKDDYSRRNRIHFSAGNIF